MTDDPATPLPKCPDCGSPLSPRAGGMCSRCLVQRALEPDGETPDLAAEPGSPGGSTVGDYELLETIGRGGMGVIYRARQRGLDREVALKLMLDGGAASPEALARFRGEAWAAARLDHPNIVPVYEVGESAGQPFLAMKLLGGGTLARRLAEGPLPAVEAARLTARIARAVHHAHQRGVLHRDLKPANILFDSQAQPLVSDFGLARLIDENTDLTRSGTVMGSPGYLAPEQARGETTAVTIATDVWGLGALLFAALTGRAPFVGQSAVETLRAVAEEELTPPSRLRLGLPRDLEIICLACLQKEPGRRYADAFAVADDLERWLDGRPISARAVGRIERTGKWIRRHPTRAALAFVVLVATGVLAFQTVRHERALRHERDLAVTSERHATASAAEALRERNRALDQAFAADLAAANAALADDQPAKARRILAVWDTPADGRAWLGFAGRWLRDRARGAPAVSYFEEGGAIVALAFSPDGKRLYSSRLDGSLHVRDLGTADASRLLRPSGPSGDTRLPGRQRSTGKRAALRVSPDERWVATFDTTRSSATLFDLTGGTNVQWDLPVTGLAFVTNAGASLRFLAAHAVFPSGNPGPGAGPPTGARYFTCEWTGSRWDQRESIRAGGIDTAFSADGSRLVCIPPNRQDVLEVWDLRENRRLMLIPVHAAILAFALAGDATRAAIGLHTPRGPALQVIDLKSGDAIAEWFDHRSPILGLTFSPDATQLASTSADMSVRLWDLKSLAPLAVLTGHAEEVMSVSYSPDGTTLATAARDGEIRLWPARAPAEKTPLPLPLGEPLALSPDGRFAAGLVGGRMEGLEPDPEFPDNGPGPGPGPGPRFGPGGGPAVLRSAVFRFGENLPRVLPASDGQPVGFVDDGRVLLAFRPDPDRRGTLVTRWDLATFEPVGEVFLDIPRLGPTTGSLSADGRRYAGTLQRIVAVFDLATGRRLIAKRFQPTGNSPGLNPMSVALSPDGQRLIVAGQTPGSGRILDADTLDHPVELEDYANPRPCLAFSSDGKLVASGLGRHQIGLWEAASGRLLHRLPGHAGVITRLAFAPDGTTLASLAFDGVVKLWHLPTGREIADVATDGRSGILQSSPDSSALFCQSASGGLRVIRAPVSR